MIKTGANGWSLLHEGFELDGALETCFTVSNGYFAIRGTSGHLYEEELPGTYAAGVYDKPADAACELVNLPYPLGLRLYIDQKPFDLRQCEIHTYRRELDMRSGVLIHEWRATDAGGRTLSYEATRFTSVSVRNLAHESYRISCENFSGNLFVESFMDGNVYNAKEKPGAKMRHFRAKGEAAEGLYVECVTNDGAYTVGIASRTLLKNPADAPQRICHFSRDHEGFLVQGMEFDVERAGNSIELERFVSCCTSREVPAWQLKSRTLHYLSAALTYGSAALIKTQRDEMARLWELSNIEIEGDPDCDAALRFCLYGLLCCVNPADEHTSIAAKGLHGEGYKGHVFWDTEVFMLPFFIYALPDYAKTLLSYRFHTLPGAKKNAALGGYRGARYAWESADTGLEETPRWGVNYKGQTVPILTGETEIHITGDVSYAMREYVRATGDAAFMAERATPVILETARFWASRAEYNSALDRYDINDVIGPDEFHEGVNNNAYTNSLAQWNLRYAAQIAAGTTISEKEIDFWREVADKIHIPKAACADGLIEQFEGYFELEDVLVTDFDENQMPLWPKNVDTANLGLYTLIKQADVVMLLHLLGEQFSPETMRENYIYYEKRTAHKSSLGSSTYALMGAKTGQHGKAYTNFYRSVISDLANIHGNTAEGLHAASAGGAWCAAFYGFCGVGFSPSGQLSIDPWLPDKWQSIKLNFNFLGRRLALFVTQDDVVLSRISGPPGLEVLIKGLPTKV